MHDFETHDASLVEAPVEREVTTPVVDERSAQLPDLAGAIRSARSTRITTATPPGPGRARRSSLAVQARLSVGAADDPSEREADAMAADVVASLSQKSGTPDARTGPRIQRSRGGAGFDVDRRFESEVRSSSGRPLPADVRTRIEPAFGGVDFSGVRLHTGQHAQRLSAEISADAFTTANNVFIGRTDFDPSSTAGTELLAHELTHVVQQGAAFGSAGVQRHTVIRRRLTSDSDKAFTTAIRSNPSYAAHKARVDKYPGTTEDNVTEEEQSTLNDVSSTWKTRKRTKKRTSGAPDETEQLEALADLIRARNLSEFADRTVELKQNTKYPDEKAKAKRRSFYLKKANEQKKKDRNLLRLGVAAPETREYLKEHGFTGAARDVQTTINPLGPKSGPAPKTRADDENPLGITTKQDVAERVRGPRIEVRSTFIGGPILGIRVRAHLFIVYTTRDGRQFYFRGGPDGANPPNTVADYGPYSADTIDYDPSAPSVTVMEGPDAEAKLDGLVHATQRVNAMKVPYEAAIAPKPLRGATGMVGEMVGMAVATDGENCNRTAWTILSNAGVPTKKPGGRHPGWGKPLGATIKGDREMEPDNHDRLDPPIDHVVTAEEAGTSGMLQTYVDRAFYVKRARVAVGTKVQIVAEGLRYRTLMIGSEKHFVQKAVAEQGHFLLVMVREALIAEKWSDDQIDEAINDATRGWAAVCGLADRLGIDEPNDVLAAIEWAQLGRTSGHEQDLLVARLDAMSDAALKEMATNLPRLGHFAKEVGVSASIVLTMVQKRVGAITERERITAKIVEVLPTPLDLNRAVNDHDDYTALHDLADQLKADMTEVFKAVDALRPDDVQGNFLYKEVVKKSWPQLVRTVARGTADLSMLADHLGVDQPFLKRVITGSADDAVVPTSTGGGKDSGPVDWAEHEIALRDEGDYREPVLMKLADTKPLLGDAMKGKEWVSVMYAGAFFNVAAADFELVEKFHRGELAAPTGASPVPDLPSADESEIDEDEFDSFIGHDVDTTDTSLGGHGAPPVAMRTKEPDKAEAIFLRAKVHFEAVNGDFPEMVHTGMAPNLAASYDYGVNNDEIAFMLANVEPDRGAEMRRELAEAMGENQRVWESFWFE